MSRPLEDVLFGAPGARPRTGTRVASWLAGAALAFGTGVWSLHIHGLMVLPLSCGDGSSFGAGEPGA